jgi:hypothetical protein
MRNNQSIERQGVTSHEGSNLWGDADRLLSGTEIEALTEGKLTDQLLRDWRSSGTNKNELPVVRIGRNVYYLHSTIRDFLTPTAA